MVSLDEPCDGGGLIETPLIEAALNAYQFAGAATEGPICAVRAITNEIAMASLDLSNLGSCTTPSLRAVTRCDAGNEVVRQV